MLPAPLEIFFVSILGLMLGSFATALSYRGERGLAWYGSDNRSFCPHCRKTMSFQDLVPLFSWLFLKGRCRRCHRPISLFYPATELAVMALCLLYYFIYGLSSPELIFPIFFALPFMWALAVIDLRTKTLPDSLVLAVAVLGAIRLFFAVLDSALPLALLINSLSGALIFGGVAWGAGALTGRLTGRAALGFGDVKFFAVSGLWLGLTDLAMFCIVAGTAGVVLGLVWRKLTGEDRFPFGPAIIFSFCVLLAFNSPLSA